LEAKVVAMRAKYTEIQVTAQSRCSTATALGLKMRNERFQMAVMNSAERRASDVTAFEGGLRKHQVRVLIYNSQASDPAAKRLMGLGAASLTALACIAHPLLASLQPESAEARGLSLGLISGAFLAVVALALAECAQIVGVLLVFTLMVGPAASAQRLTTRLGPSIVLFMALAEAWAEWRLPTGPTGRQASGSPHWADRPTWWRASPWSLSLRSTRTFGGSSS